MLPATLTKRFALVLQRLMSKRWLRYAFVLLPAFMLIAVLLLPPLLNGYAHWLIRRDVLPPIGAGQVDLVIALGGDVHCYRERQAAELYRAGRGRKVLVSGVAYGWGLHTADVLQQVVRNSGVPESDILVLRDQFNTRTEALSIAALMREQQWQTAIVVTTDFHSRRALLTLEGAGKGLRFYSAPVSGQPGDWQPMRWWQRRFDAGITVRETLSWINTLLKGWE